MSEKAVFDGGKWLLCRPEDFDVRYVINPWMDLKVMPDKQKAYSQWQNLHHHLLRLGAWIEYVKHQDGLPDMVFTANAGLARGTNVVLSKFRYQERQGEEIYFQKWFEEYGFKVHILKAHAFEGEGDALFLGDTLLAGHGFRSNLTAYDEIAKILAIDHVIPMHLVDPRFYHLDTCLCPLDSKTVMLYPKAFSPESLKKIEQHAEILPVKESEALHFVCNAVVLNKKIVLPANCPETYAMLNARGFETHPIELTEFIKAGGAAKCLTIRLDRGL